VPFVHLYRRVKDAVDVPVGKLKGKTISEVLDFHGTRPHLTVWRFKTESVHVAQMVVTSAAFTVMYALSIRKTAYLGEERQDRVFGSKGDQNVPKCQKDAQADANAHGVLSSY
jgi:hypothetical protein